MNDSILFALICMFALMAIPFVAFFDSTFWNAKSYSLYFVICAIVVYIVYLYGWFIV